MKFVDYNSLDRTIKSLSELRDEIKQDKRIKMDNALSDVITRATMIKLLLDEHGDDAANWHLIGRCKSLAESVKRYDAAIRDYE